MSGISGDVVLNDEVQRIIFANIGIHRGEQLGEQLSTLKTELEDDLIFLLLGIELEGQSIYCQFSLIYNRL